MYSKYIKRLLDCLLAACALVVFTPLMALLALVGAVAFRGNPIFIQKRPGQIHPKTHEERIIPLLKFRSMTDERDDKGELLPNAQRLTTYGRLLRKTSLDELPSLWNVLLGHLALVGPRPLLVKYLPRYTKEQRRRHEVRPGITGYAQAYGRNALSWEEKFQKDVYYVDHVSLGFDLKILFKTVAVVLRQEGISSKTSATMEEFMGSPREEK